MKTILGFLILNLLFLNTFSQKAEAYKIYNSKGKEVSFKKIIKDLEKSDIVLFGEFHNNPISHWMKYEIIHYLTQNKEIILGSEIFEADDQIHLSAYIKNEINFEVFDSLARLWPNYKTDYSQIIELAKNKRIDFVATNIPRKYARLVNRFGFEALDSLPKAEKGFIAPLPIEYDPELPGYKSMLEMGSKMGHTSANFPKAQAIKDATMAYFINKNYVQDKLFFHFHGAYHTDNYEGILWYLKRLASDLKYITISTVTQKDVFELDNINIGRADYIIVVNENVTTSY